jgi:hypothetical protein
MIITTAIMTALVAAQANVTGNCVTGRITFDQLRYFPDSFFRTYALGATDPGLDVSTYDMTTDYGNLNVKPIAGGGVNLNLAKSPQNTGLG